MQWFAECYLVAFWAVLKHLKLLGHLRKADNRRGEVVNGSMFTTAPGLGGGFCRLISWHNHSRGIKF